MIGLTKGIIRSKILLKIKTQKEEPRNKKSKIIGKKLFRTKVFKEAKIIMFYMSFGGEVDTQNMICKAQKLGKIIAVPVCKTDKMLMRPCLLHKNVKLQRGPYGVMEPAIKKIISLKNLDLVIVPGVAFEKSGNRLGRGKGSYDHFLRKLSDKTTSIGLAFDFQILPAVPTTTTDVRVDKVIFA